MGGLIEVQHAYIHFRQQYESDPDTEVFALVSGGFLDSGVVTEYDSGRSNVKMLNRARVDAVYLHPAHDMMRRKDGCEVDASCDGTVGRMHESNFAYLHMLESEWFSRYAWHNFVRGDGVREELHASEMGTSAGIGGLNTNVWGVNATNLAAGARGSCRVLEQPGVDAMVKRNIAQPNIERGLVRGSDKQKDERKAAEEKGAEDAKVAKIDTAPAPAANPETEQDRVEHGIAYDMSKKLATMLNSYQKVKEDRAVQLAAERSPAGDGPDVPDAFDGTTESGASERAEKENEMKSVCFFPYTDMNAGREKHTLGFDVPLSSNVRTDSEPLAYLKNLFDLHTARGVRCALRVILTNQPLPDDLLLWANLVSEGYVVDAILGGSLAAPVNLRLRYQIPTGYYRETVVWRPGPQTMGAITLNPNGEGGGKVESVRTIFLPAGECEPELTHDAVNAGDIVFRTQQLQVPIEKPLHFPPFYPKFLHYLERPIGAGGAGAERVQDPGIAGAAADEKNDLIAELHAAVVRDGGASSITVGELSDIQLPIRWRGLLDLRNSLTWDTHYLNFMTDAVREALEVDVAFFFPNHDMQLKFGQFVNKAGEVQRAPQAETGPFYSDRIAVLDGTDAVEGMGVAGEQSEGTDRSGQQEAAQPADDGKDSSDDKSANPSGGASATKMKSSDMKVQGEFDENGNLVVRTNGDAHPAKSDTKPAATTVVTTSKVPAASPSASRGSGSSSSTSGASVGGGAAAGNQARAGSLLELLEDPAPASEAEAALPYEPRKLTARDLYDQFSGRRVATVRLSALEVVALTLERVSETVAGYTGAQYVRSLFAQSGIEVQYCGDKIGRPDRADYEKCDEEYESEFGSAETRGATNADGAAPTGTALSDEISSDADEKAVLAAAVSTEVFQLGRLLAARRKGTGSDLDLSGADDQLVADVLTMRNFGSGTGKAASAAGGSDRFTSKQDTAPSGQVEQQGNAQAVQGTAEQQAQTPSGPSENKGGGEAKAFSAFIELEDESATEDSAPAEGQDAAAPADGAGEYPPEVIAAAGILQTDDKRLNLLAIQLGLVAGEKPAPKSVPVANDRLREGERILGKSVNDRTWDAHFKASAPAPAYEAAAQVPSPQADVVQASIAAAVDSSLGGAKSATEGGAGSAYLFRERQIERQEVQYQTRGVRRILFVGRQHIRGNRHNRRKPKNACTQWGERARFQDPSVSERSAVAERELDDIRALVDAICGFFEMRLVLWDFERGVLPDVVDALKKHPNERLRERWGPHLKHLFFFDVAMTDTANEIVRMWWRKVFSDGGDNFPRLLPAPDLYGSFADEGPDNDLRYASLRGAGLAQAWATVSDSRDHGDPALDVDEPTAAEVRLGKAEDDAAFVRGASYEDVASSGETAGTHSVGRSISVLPVSSPSSRVESDQWRQLQAKRRQKWLRLGFGGELALYEALMAAPAAHETRSIEPLFPRFRESEPLFRRFQRDRREEHVPEVLTRFFTTKRGGGLLDLLEGARRRGEVNGRIPPADEVENAAGDEVDGVSWTELAELDVDEKDGVLKRDDGGHPEDVREDPGKGASMSSTPSAATRSRSSERPGGSASAAPVVAAPDPDPQARTMSAATVTEHDLDQDDVDEHEVSLFQMRMTHETRQEEAESANNPNTVLNRLFGGNQQLFGGNAIPLDHPAVVESGPGPATSGSGTMTTSTIFTLGRRRQPEKKMAGPAVLREEVLRVGDVETQTQGRGGPWSPEALQRLKHWISVQSAEKLRMPSWEYWLCAELDEIPPKYSLAASTDDPQAPGTGTTASPPPSNEGMVLSVDDFRFCPSWRTYDFDDAKNYAEVKGRDGIRRLDAFRKQLATKVLAAAKIFVGGDLDKLKLEKIVRAVQRPQGAVSSRFGVADTNRKAAPADAEREDREADRAALHELLQSIVSSANATQEKWAQTESAQKARGELAFRPRWRPLGDAKRLTFWKWSEDGWLTRTRIDEESVEADEESAEEVREDRMVVLAAVFFAFALTLFFLASRANNNAGDSSSWLGDGGAEDRGGPEGGAAAGTDGGEAGAKADDQGDAAAAEKDEERAAANDGDQDTAAAAAASAKQSRNAQTAAESGEAAGAEDAGQAEEAFEDAVSSAAAAETMQKTDVEHGQRSTTVTKSDGCSKDSPTVCERGCSGSDSKANRRAGFCAAVGE
eukprot:g7107.t1